MLIIPQFFVRPAPPYGVPPNMDGLYHHDVSYLWSNSKKKGRFFPMAANERTAESGGIIISDDVIAAVAANAVKDVDGFSGFSCKAPGLLSGMLQKENTAKSVKVTAQDNDVKVHVYIRVKSGTNIQTVSTAIQRSVKNAVQSMTGKVVSKVNVSVQGIDFDAPNELKANS